MIRADRRFFAELPERSPRAVILPADPLDRHEVAEGMRKADRDEVAFTAAVPPAVAVARSAQLSHETWAGRWDGVAVCLFGLGYGSALGGLARPWLLATPELEEREIALAFLRRNRFVIRRWRMAYSLENWVMADNLKSIKWLEWLGFAIDDPAPFGPFGRPFRRFSMERLPCAS